MSKSRFELAFDNYDGWAMQDTIGEYTDDEDYFGWLSGQKAVDVMNHFAEENERLKQIIDTLRFDNTKQKKKLNTVMKENEELKTIISNYMDCIDKLAIENEKLKGQLKIENYPDFLNGLVEKNEQLSEENKRLVKMLDNVANYMQKQNKNIPIDDFVEWWNNIATRGIMK